MLMVFSDKNMHLHCLLYLQTNSVHSQKHSVHEQLKCIISRKNKGENKKCHTYFQCLQSNPFAIRRLLLSLKITHYFKFSYYSKRKIFLSFRSTFEKALNKLKITQNFEKQLFNLITVIFLTNKLICIFLLLQSYLDLKNKNIRQSFEISHPYYDRMSKHRKELFSRVFLIGRYIFLLFRDAFMFIPLDFSFEVENKTLRHIKMCSIGSQLQKEGIFQKISKWSFLLCISLRCALLQLNRK